MTVNVIGSASGTAAVLATRSYSGITDTLVIGDANNRVESTGSSSVTETIPTNASVAFPVDTLIELSQYGSGQVEIVGAAGVTIDSPGGLVHTRTQFSTVGLFYRGSNVWILSGDLG